MKPSLKKAVPAVLLLSFLSTVPGSAVRLKPGQDKPKVSTADLWKLVEAADRDGLPRTAIEHLKEIVRLSLEEKREGEALRALTRRLVL